MLATADGYARGHFDAMTAHLVSTSFSPDTFEVRLPPLPGVRPRRPARRPPRPGGGAQGEGRRDQARQDGHPLAVEPPPTAPSSPTVPVDRASRRPRTRRPSPHAARPDAGPRARARTRARTRPEPAPSPSPHRSPTPAPEPPPAPAPPTRAEAEATCTGNGLVDDPDTDDDEFDACVAQQLATKP